MAPKPITENTLFYGDNLDILRQYIADNSVDLFTLTRRLSPIRNPLTETCNPSSSS